MESTGAESSPNIHPPLEKWCPSTMSHQTDDLVHAPQEPYIYIGTTNGKRLHHFFPLTTMSHNNNHNNNKSCPPTHQTLNLAWLEQQQQELQVRLAWEEVQIEAAMRAEQARMEEERREAEERWRVKQLRREEAEKKRHAEEVQKQQEAGRWRTRTRRTRRSWRRGWVPPKRRRCRTQ